MGACLSGSVLPPPNPELVDITHFELLKVVGKGGFGKVNAITARSNGELLALKRIEKAQVLKSKAHLSMVWTERLIMSLVKSPFLCHLRYAFESDTELFLVMPFLQGGDLRFHLKEKGRMSENTARFYAAQMILGLEELHHKNIVYRDLKPENILFDDLGNLRITDFGLACLLKQEDGFRTRGQAGTRGYMAPETLALRGYGLSVDVFSFGVVLYELLHGWRPWKSLDPARVLQKIDEPIDQVAASKSKKAYDACKARRDEARTMSDESDSGDDESDTELHFSSRLSEEAQSLLSGLLCLNPSNRLGCRHTNTSLNSLNVQPPSEDVVTTPLHLHGWHAIKAHPFFLQVDWDAMSSLEARPPFQPDVTQANCTPDADLADQLLDRKPKKVSDEEQKAFVGWSWNTQLRAMDDDMTQATAMRSRSTSISIPGSSVPANLAETGKRQDAINENTATNDATLRSQHILIFDSILHPIKECNNPNGDNHVNISLVQVKSRELISHSLCTSPSQHNAHNTSPSALMKSNVSSADGVNQQLPEITASLTGSTSIRKLTIRSSASSHLNLDTQTYHLPNAIDATCEESGLALHSIHSSSSTARPSIATS